MLFPLLGEKKPESLGQLCHLPPGATQPLLLHLAHFRGWDEDGKGGKSGGLEFGSHTLPHDVFKKEVSGCRLTDFFKAHFISENRVRVSLFQVLVEEK